MTKILTILLAGAAASLFAQRSAPIPDIKFESVPFLRLTYDRNLGEVLGVAVNSKGHAVVLNHPGTRKRNLKVSTALLTHG